MPRDADKIATPAPIFDECEKCGFRANLEAYNSEGEVMVEVSPATDYMPVFRERFYTLALVEVGLQKSGPDRYGRTDAWRAWSLTPLGRAQFNLLLKREDRSPK